MSQKPVQGPSDHDDTRAKSETSGGATENSHDVDAIGVEIVVVFLRLRTFVCAVSGTLLFH